MSLDALRPWYRDWIRLNEQELIKNLRKGQADGSIRATLDPEQQAEQFVSYGIGLCFRWTVDRENYDLAQAVRGWRRTIAHALTTP